MNVLGVLTCAFDLADQGTLHKAISLEGDMHIIEEIQLFQDSEPVQTLLLSSKKVKGLRQHGWVAVLLGGCLGGFAHL